MLFETLLEWRFEMTDAKRYMDRMEGISEGRGKSVVDMLIDQNDVADLMYKGPIKDDEQSQEMAHEVYSRLREILTLTDSEYEAFNRLRMALQNKKTWDGALTRNNLFKAANSLGIKLPSASF